MPIIYVDGQSQGNEQKAQRRSARIAIALQESGAADPSSLKIVSQEIGDKTNNEAEYFALLKALVLIERGWNETMGKPSARDGSIIVRSDSKLVVNQVNGEWQVKDPKLVELNNKARNLVQRLGSVRLEWVPREENLAGLWIEGKIKARAIERLPSEVF